MLSRRQFFGVVNAALAFLGLPMLFRRESTIVGSDIELLRLHLAVALTDLRRDGKGPFVIVKADGHRGMCRFNSNDACFPNVSKGDEFYCFETSWGFWGHGSCYDAVPGTVKLWTKDMLPRGWATMDGIQNAKPQGSGVTYAPSHEKLERPPIRQNPNDHDHNGRSVPPYLPLKFIERLDPFGNA